MTRFNEKIGAGVMVALAVVYMVLALATGKSASADTPPDLSMPKAGVGVWQASKLLVDKAGKVAVLDVRPKDLFDAYHMRGAVSLPGAGPEQVLAQAKGKAAVLLVGNKDKDMALLAGKVKAANKGLEVHFLRDSVRGWYLTYELPVEVFSAKPPPFGWKDAMATARAWFRDGKKGDPAKVLAAINKLANLNFSPSLLQGKKKKTGSGKKKKISGGCSG